jgi:hypothetical protein
VGISMKYFQERRTVLWSLSVLLLSACGGAEPECDTHDTRNSVVKIVSGDTNNAPVNYAAKNSISAPSPPTFTKPWKL